MKTSAIAAATLLALSALAAAIASGTAAAYNPGDARHKPNVPTCRIGGLEYVFASQQTFPIGNTITKWARFQVYQREFTCQVSYVGLRWCKFTQVDRYSRPYIFDCQVLSPRPVTWAPRAG